MTNNDHPSYCYRRKCRKSAWETPEYLTADDYEMIALMIPAIESGDVIFIATTLYADATTARAQGFFNRVLGWPEGYGYCIRPEYLTATGITLMETHLPDLRAALAAKGSK